MPRLETLKISLKKHERFPVKASAETELCNTLHSKRCKKRTLNGKYALLLRLCIHITGSSLAVMPLPLTTHHSYLSQQLLPLTLITSHLLTRTNIAADVDVTNALLDAGGETTTTSTLIPTLLLILVISLSHTTRPNY